VTQPDPKVYELFTHVLEGRLDLGHFKMFTPSPAEEETRFQLRNHRPEALRAFGFIS
jgi:hypothetical protein